MNYLQSQIENAATRNRELLNTLAETDAAPTALETQNRYVQELAADLKTLKGRIRLLDEKRKKELKDHEKYRDSVMKRFAYKVSGNQSKFAAKAEKEEREYFDALQEEHKAKEQEKQLLALQEQAIAEQAEQKSRAERHVQAQTELDSLYASIFEGPTPEFPEEDSLEQRTRGAQDAYSNISAKLEAEICAKKILIQAQARMQAALASMEDALDYSRMDMWGGGNMVDMMERNALHSAETSLLEVRMQIMQAQRMQPVIQELPDAHIHHGNIMSDVFFDNIFSDMAFHDKIKESKVNVQRAAQALQAQVDNAQGRIVQLQLETNTQADELAKARSELQSAREGIFEKMLQSNNESMAQAQEKPWS